MGIITSTGKSRSVTHQEKRDIMLTQVEADALVKDINDLLEMRPHDLEIEDPQLHATYECLRVHARQLRDKIGGIS